MKWLFSIAFILFWTCLTNGGSWLFHKEQPSDISPPVQALCDAYWNWRMTDMPEYATFVGIHDYDDRLDDMSEAAYYVRLEKCQEFLASANALEPTLVNDTDIINIGVLKYELQTYIESYYLQGFYLPMNYLEGVQVDMENQFGWMLLDTFEDYNTMIARMQKIPLQINQIISLMQAGVAKNITYHVISMKYMNESLGRFVVDDPTDSPLYVYFNGSFPDTFTPEQITNIQARAKLAINDSVTPAYSALRYYILNKYVTRPDIAVTSIYRGDEFYRNCIWFHTSTNLSAQEIQDIGYEEVDRIEQDMYQAMVVMGYGNMTTQQFSDMIRNDPNNFYDNADDLMAGFDSIVYDLVPPQLPTIFNRLPTVELQVVADPSPGGAGAYYLGGSYDGTRPGVFYVNTYYPEAQPKYSMLTLSLHESNPGHNLQGALAIESPDYPFFRRVTEDRNYGISPSRFPLYTYYVEGWALYAEALGFDMHLYGDPLERYGHYSEEIFRACRLVVDTGMHALGWTREQAIEYMFNHTASSLQDIENEIDRYITWPGQALAYKMGQLKIQNLRNQSETDLGDLFNIKDFHDVVLNSLGPMNLVEDEVNKWVEETLAGGFEIKN